MSTGRTIRIIPVMAESWQGAFAAVRRMLPALLALSLLFVVLTYLEARVIGGSGSLDAPVPNLVVLALKIFAFEIAGAAVLSLMAMAIQRFIILGDTTTVAAFANHWPRFLHIFAYAAVITLALNLPLFQIAAEADYGLKHGFPFPELPFVAEYFGYAAALVILVMCFGLFPAIAVGAPGASFNNAMDDTWFSLGRILMLIFFCALPVVVVQAVLWYVFMADTGALPRLPFFVFTKSVPKLLLVWVLAAASAHVYRCYANRLGRPPQPSTPSGG